MKIPVKRLIQQARAVALAFHRDFHEAQLPLVAGSLAYTTILSLIPLLAVSFAIFQAFGGMDKLYAVVEPLIVQNLAQDAGGEAMKAIQRFVENAHAGAIGAGGFVGLIVTSMSMLSSIEKAINKVWKVAQPRPIAFRITAYWFVVTLGPLALAVAIGVATSSSIPLRRLFPSGTGMFLLSIFIFFLVYKWVPNCRVQWKPAFISATLTAVAWHIVREGYALYTRKVVSYNKIYGSLGAVPILLLWIYIVWLVVLTGAAITAALQRRSK